MKKGRIHLSSISKIVHHPVFLLSIVILGFILAFTSVYPIRIQQMGTGEFFIESILPLQYWIGVALILVAAFLMIRFLADERFIVLLVFSSIILMVSLRMVFPMIFPKVVNYEPDAANYIGDIQSWITNGWSFGIAGAYQHDYPLSFLIAFGIIKLGVPIETFFKVAPFCIYAIEIVLLYLIVGEIIPKDRKIGAISAFLFSFTSLPYWIAVHYSPDLVGGLFFFVALYLSIRFAKKGEWTLRAVLPTLLFIFLLILAHHLSTLYFIVTMLGLALSTQIFKVSAIKGKALSFLMLGVFTYTIWFSYGTLMYPNFFNVYVYFNGGGTVGTLLQQAPLFETLSGGVYPLFILTLFALMFFELLKIQSLRDMFRLRSKLKEAGGKATSLVLLYSVGFAGLVILFFVGFVITTIYPPRILEVLLIGLYPVASLKLAKVAAANSSKKWMILLLILVLLVGLVTVHRYYSLQERRVILGI
jgi:hypothetical protein